MPQELTLAPGTVLVYRLRVAHPGEPASRLATRAGLPEDQVRAAEEELATVGLLRPSRSGGWLAIAPEEAAERFLGQTEVEIAQQHFALAAARARLHSLSGDYLEARSLRGARDAIEHISGADNVRSLIDELVRTSRASVRAFIPVVRSVDGALRAALPLDLNMLARGVRIAYLCGDATVRVAPFATYAGVVAEAGGQVRTIASLPTRLLIYDEASALLPADPATPGARAVLVRDPAVVGYLVRLFDHLWAQAVPYRAGAAVAPDPPDGVEREVLRRIAAGRTNEAIARELGISPRTVTRHTAALLRRLGTDSRFRAGVLAVRLGWLN